MNRMLLAARTDAPPEIDGVLLDEIWTKAALSDQFTQQFPDDGERPSLRTTVQVAFDDRFLYLAIDAYDPEPERISARLARRDSRIDSDYIEIFLDTRHDHDNGYWFRINAAGVLDDGEIHDDFRINFDWDAVWRASSKIHTKGWSAEFAIPLSILRFSGASTSQWGLNVVRRVRRTGEIMQWVHIPRTESGALSRAGHIVGIESIDARRALELRPFLVGRVASALPDGGSRFALDGTSDPGASAGLDAKLGVTDGLTLDLTLNPDFGQVEADPIVLNLSTFENFFPEKRPFFLEGAALMMTDLRMFHSRRIGDRRSGLQVGSTVRLADGSEATVTHTPLFVPILGAARLTGSIGKRFIISALGAATGAESLLVESEDMQREVDVVPLRFFGATRGKYSFGGSSYLGFIATAMARHGEALVAPANHDSHSESIDGRWVASDGMYRLYFQVARSQRVGGDRFRDGDAYCAGMTSCRPIARADGTLLGPGDAGWAGEFGGSKAGGNLRFFGNYRFVAPRFEVADVGFEDDWDYHRLYATTSYQHEKSFAAFQRGQVSLDANGQVGFDGTRRNLTIGGSASALSRRFWTPLVSVSYLPPGSFSVRETTDGARYERHDSLALGAELSSDTRASVAGNLAAELGHSPSSHHRSYSARAGLDVRALAPFELGLSTGYAHSDSDLRVIGCTSSDGGSCWRGSPLRSYVLAEVDSTALDLTARASLALSPTLVVESYLQVFAGRGRYHDYQEILDQTGERPELARAEVEGSDFDGDLDGDGDSDNDFAFATLNANVVGRWEFSPGATLIGVYTRAQRHDRARPRFGFAGLRSGAAEEIVLLKLTLFWSR